MTASRGTVTIRTFIAIAAPPAIIDALQALQTRAHSVLPCGLLRWSRPEHLHLTLRFLGNVSTELIEGLQVALQRACEGVQAFRLDLDGLGCFPNENSPRVIWVGVGGNLDSLREIQQRIVAATSGFGSHTDTDAFHPHLTIGRVGSLNRRIPDVQDFLKEIWRPVPNTWLVTGVDLMESRISGQGTHHVRLATARLSAPARA